MAVAGVLAGHGDRRHFDTLDGCDLDGCFHDVCSFLKIYAESSCLDRFTQNCVSHLGIEFAHTGEFLGAAAGLMSNHAATTTKAENGAALTMLEFVEATVFEESKIRILPVDVHDILVITKFVVAIAAGENLTARSDAKGITTLAAAKADVFVLGDEPEIFGRTRPETNDRNTFSFSILTNFDKSLNDLVDWDVYRTDNIDIDANFSHVERRGPVNDRSIDIEEVVFGYRHGETVKGATFIA